MIKNIKIGGHKVKIEMFDSFGSISDEIGLCIPSSNTIKISKSFNGDAIHNDVICESILHEVLHFIDYVYCGYNLEEETIRSLGKFLYHVFNNSDILNFTKTVDILGFKYKIKYNCRFDETVKKIAVDANRITQVISVIGKESVNGEICDEYIITRLLVGILGAINAEYIDSEELSDRLDSFAQGVYQVLVDNKGFKDLFKWGK